MASIRQDKVSKLIQRDLATIFQEQARELFDGAFITITVVRMSPDLGAARVFLSFFTTGGTDKGTLLNMVRERTSAVRGLLGRKIGKQVRTVPELYFYLDDSLDYADEIDRLLKS
jgi:ribosome-binding factor A